jgi:radical SAM superfamily enzyme YgiQ (UPF0313 family)
LDVPVIWGGVHPTMHPMECLEYTEMICIGEGEEALTELAHKIENREDVYTTSNIWFKHDTQIIKNKPRPLIQNLESTIHIDCNFTDHYVESNRQIKKITEALLEKGTANEYLVHATRGCPNRCTYCTNSKLNEIYPEGAKIRKRLNGAVEELIEIKKRMPRLNYIRIVDDAFLSCTDDEIKLFCERYKKGIGVPFFVGGITPQNITRQKLSLLVDAGLVSLRMGIESASEKTLKMYRRNSSTKQIENAAKIINEFKDKIKLPIYDIIIENPWETDQEIAETLIFLSKLPVPYRMNLFSLRLFPGTALYENAKQKGFLEENDEDITSGPYKVLKKSYMNSLLSR